MKKICHLTIPHSRYDERIFLKECRSLAKAGYEVTLLCADNKPDEFIDGVTIKSVPFQPKKRIARILNAKKIMLRYAINLDADLYHFHDPELLQLGLALKKRGKIIIYDSHEDVPRQILSKIWIPLIFRKLISYYFEKYEKAAAQKINFVISATPHIEQTFRNYCPHVSTVYNYPLLSEFEAIQSWEKKKASCCYIGGISENRGINQLIEAIDSTKINLNLCGNFDSVELQNKIFHSPGFKFVHFYGFLNREEVIKVLSESMIGMVTLLASENHVKSYPIKMFEYMAAGIPVISSDFPLWKEILQTNDCGIPVNPYDVNSIANAINYLIARPDEAERMGKNGYNAFIDRYNWATQEVILIGVYNQLFSQKY